ncbi:MAG: M20/M25/M40 family metallo-hydrolase [Pirellulaceae bacterium]
MTKRKRTKVSAAESRQESTGRSAVAGVWEPDLQRALQLVLELMPIAGPSCEEGAIADAVEAKLLEAGADRSMIHRDTAHRRTPTPGQTGNLMLKLPGTVRRPRRMLAAHLDTVPICVGCQPVIEKRMVRSADPRTGLGADNRAGVATILTAALEILKRSLPHPPLTFCWFVQEEIGLQGSRCVDRKMLGNPALAFNWDGGPPEKLTIGATGGCRMDIEVTGLASHAGVAPERGVSAIAVASLAIADLHENGWHGLVSKGRKRGTSNVGVIQGGDATNVVTDRVQLRAEARSHDSAFRQRIEREMEKAFERAVKKVKNMAGAIGHITIARRVDYESFLLATDETCVVAADAAVQGVGLTPFQAVANGGLDANWTTRHGIPTVTLGCGQVNPHMVSEALDVTGFEQACRIALRLATDCDRDPPSA